jgi:hypothetical protein
MRTCLPKPLPAGGSAQAGRVPLGFAVRMGRRNLCAGRRNGSRAAQIVTESPGRQCPTTETADAAGEEILETPGALPKPGCLLRRPMRTADPFRSLRKKTKIIITQLRYL